MEEMEEGEEKDASLPSLLSAENIKFNVGKCGDHVILRWHAHLSRGQYLSAIEYDFVAVLTCHLYPIESPIAQLDTFATHALFVNIHMCSATVLNQ